ncbi:hypothetical protein ACFWH1_04480 [Streptomyces sp. NPDC127037]|uniref:hypothetical protein n=1 Tax=Streptomyces sp. NPDC127037 TaxID=3347113 RepID=UPI003653488C
MDSGWMAVWPVAAFFLGGLATQFTALLNHRRQRAERAEDSAAALRQRREEFELTHLVEVNSLLHADAKALGVFSDARIAWTRERRAGAGLEPAYPDGEWDALEAANAELQSQVGFILADEVRHEVEAARLAVLGTARTVRAGSDDPEFESLAVTLQTAHSALAARVREIYAGRHVGGRASR